MGRPARSGAHAPLPAEIADALADVVPMPAPNRADVGRVPPAPVAAQRLADEADALAESRSARAAGPAVWDVGVDSEAEQSFLRPGLPPDLLRKLRRGVWLVQGELDLHRHTIAQARHALGEFLVASRKSGWRCVRVVHGKGLGSPNREPRLKGKVRRWLQQRDEVLAYCEPRPHAGGAGAVLVLLRGQRTI